ncbi:hypothetical protein B0H11DRAFT_1917700 [Mycena galericulata]|nr:hypothetical protein B0H11DRAFT_1917700 [Mycena galericulata]
MFSCWQCLHQRCQLYQLARIGAGDIKKVPGAIIESGARTASDSIQSTECLTHQWVLPRPTRDQQNKYILYIHGTCRATIWLPRYLCLTTPADALLPFITTLPPVHPDLLAGTLAFYAAHRYRLCAHIAAPLAAIAAQVCMANADRGVQHMWADLLGAWAVCSADRAQYFVEPPFGPQSCSCICDGSCRAWRGTGSRRGLKSCEEGSRMREGNRRGTETRRRRDDMEGWHGCHQITPYLLTLSGLQYTGVIWDPTDAAPVMGLARLQTRTPRGIDQSAELRRYPTSRHKCRPRRLRQTLVEDPPKRIRRRRARVNKFSPTKAKLEDRHIGND